MQFIYEQSQNDPVIINDLIRQIDNAVMKEVPDFRYWIHDKRAKAAELAKKSIEEDNKVGILDDESCSIKK